MFSTFLQSNCWNIVVVAHSWQSDSVCLNP
uniref:Uncharacterized protein n=1 Tax=Arundo donax TaxID=35708 RepID=A0A0A9FLJ2_ARUDO